MLRNKICGLKSQTAGVLVLSGKGLVLPFNGSLGDVGQNRGVSDLQENANNLHALLSNPV